MDKFCQFLPATQDFYKTFVIQELILHTFCCLGSLLLSSVTAQFPGTTGKATAFTVFVGSSRVSQSFYNLYAQIILELN